MLYKQLKQYANSDVYPFHMPGHKRQDINGDGSLPYALDLTEIPDFDNLHDPDGNIKAIEEQAAELYGVDHALISVNGATGGLLAAVKSMTKRRDRILMARNCHRSVYHAAQLSGLVPDYCYPDSLTVSIYGSVKPDMIEKQLQATAGVVLVIITSPTYEGVCSDIESIARVCHRHGAMLLVDEAHGAHFPFHNRFPRSAVLQGADAAVVSLHKTLPALTQTALLLTNNSSLAQKLRGNMAIFETSSPSYILMSSVEQCLCYVKAHPQAFEAYVQRLDLFYNRIKTLSHLAVLPPNDGRDFGKIVILTTDTNLTGHKLAAILRDTYHLETEMASTDYVIAMTSVCDTDEGFERLINALISIDKACEPQMNPSFSLPNQAPPRALLPHEAENNSGKLCSWTDAAGKVSLEYISAYPPGIPLLVPGEIISGELISYITYLLENGVEVTSSAKNMPDCVSVAEM